VPEVLGRRDHERWLSIRVKRAQPSQVCSVAFQLDALRFRQPLHRYFLLDPLDLRFR